MHVCTRARAGVPHFRISETARRIALKFGVWLETQWLGVLQKFTAGYSISEAAGRIELKFGLWFVTH